MQGRLGAVLEVLEASNLRRAEKEYLRRKAVEAAVAEPQVAPGTCAASCKLLHSSLQSAHGEQRTMESRMDRHARSILDTAEDLRLLMASELLAPANTLHTAVNLLRRRGYCDGKLIKDLNALNDAATAMKHMDEVWLSELRTRVANALSDVTASAVADNNSVNCSTIAVQTDDEEPGLVAPDHLDVWFADSSTVGATQPTESFDTDSMDAGPGQAEDSIGKVLMDAWPTDADALLGAKFMDADPMAYESNVSNDSLETPTYCGSDKSFAETDGLVSQVAALCAAAEMARQDGCPAQERIGAWSEGSDASLAECGHQPEDAIIDTQKLIVNGDKDAVSADPNNCLRSRWEDLTLEEEDEKANETRAETMTYLSAMLLKMQQKGIIAIAEREVLLQIAAKPECNLLELIAAQLDPTCASK
jgi:hypothetical protein